VVHDDELSREERSRWAAAEQAGHLRWLAAFGADLVYGVDQVALARSLRLHLAAPGVLAAGADVTVGLRFEGDATRPWAQGAPHRVARGVARWRHLDTETLHATPLSVVLPLVVGADERVPRPLRLRAPAKAGRYALEVELDVPPITTARQTLEIRDAPRLATSAEADVRLGARYRLDDGDAPRRLDPATAFRLRIVAVNAGEAVWLSKPRGKKGDVALEWRWLDATGHPAPEGAGRTPLRYDVHPGQSYEFDEWPTVPAEAGRYVLEARLVVEGVGTQASADPPVRIAVEARR
jgi:hypothetical protein